MAGAHEHCLRCTGQKVLHVIVPHSSQDHILSTYDRAISSFTQTEFGRSGITCVLNTRVAAISKGEVTLVNACVRHPMCPALPALLGVESVVQLMRALQADQGGIYDPLWSLRMGAPRCIEPAPVYDTFTLLRCI